MLVRITDTRTGYPVGSRVEANSNRAGEWVARGWAEPAQPLVREMLKPGPSGACRPAGEVSDA